jgi:Zn finger protein HypA/HybF involved in hydrogenase expression
MMRILEREYRKTRGGRVTAVRLVVGGMHQLVEESFRTAFEALAAETPFADARLELEHVGVTARCPACGWEGAIAVPFFLCGSCGRGGLETLTGRELYIKEIELEDHET